MDKVSMSFLFYLVPNPHQLTPKLVHACSFPAAGNSISFTYSSAGLRSACVGEAS